MRQLRSSTREGRERLGTHLGGTCSCCGNKGKAIEDEFCASGESEEDNVSLKMGTWNGTRADLKRVKNETGLRSPSTGAVTRRSGVGDFSGEAKVGESNLSSGFGLSSEIGPSGGEKVFSLLTSVVDMVDATRRDGGRLGKRGTEEVEHADDGLPVFLLSTNAAHGKNFPANLTLHYNT